MQLLIDGGYEAYIIGGAVRDLMIGCKPSDWDIFTNASGNEILSIFPHGKVIGNDERRAKILTVVVSGVEVSQYRANGDRTETGNSLEEHLSTCDFTINSMAMDIGGNIIDNHHGTQHLDTKELCCVGNPEDRIEEDTLRVFRAIRFMVKYDLTIDDEQLNKAISIADVSNIPIERVREEILKTFVYKHALEKLEYSNLLSKIVPEFEPSFCHIGGRHHAETVDTHMYNAQNIACELTDNPILIFACAFHDIGKPCSAKHEDNGGVSFHNHDKVGAELIRDIMTRMKFSNADTKFVETLISEHMFGHNHNTSNKTYIKHFRRLEDAGISIMDYMIMQYSDHQANTKSERIKFGDYVKDNKLLAKYYELKFSSVPFRIADLAVSGRDLLAIGIPPGIEIGNMLNNLFDEVITGDLKNTRHVLMYRIKHMEKQ